MHRADLERSFRELEGCNHFHAHSMRGRIRTLQLRLEEAWEHFDFAEVLSRRSAETIPNLRRTFLLQVYRFDNALLESPESEELEIDEPALPRFPEELLEEFPDLRAVLRMRTRVQGSYLLHAGRWPEALEIFARVIEDRSSRHGDLAQSYLSMACCHYNLGNDREVDRFLDSAELAVHACDALLAKAHLCGLLYAVHRVREDGQKADEWREFLFSLSCPQATKDNFLAWGDRFVELCNEHNRLVVF
jgi:hypothetical protein